LPSRDAAGKTRKRYSKFAKFITFPISENRLRSSGCGPIMNDMLKKALFLYKGVDQNIHVRHR